MKVLGVSAGGNADLGFIFRKKPCIRDSCDPTFLLSPGGGPPSPLLKNQYACLSARIIDSVIGWGAYLGRSNRLRALCNSFKNLPVFVSNTFDGLRRAHGETAAVVMRKNRVERNSLGADADGPEVTPCIPSRV